MGRNRRYMSWVVGLSAVMLIAAACSSGSAASDDTQEAPSGGAEGQAVEGGDDRSVIRFAFSPDPVFQYMLDTGELAKWEEENNLRIVPSKSWDDFAYFAGGHSEVGFAGTYELPLLEEATGKKLVAFGKYTRARMPLLRKAGDRFETLEDVPEDATTCANSAVADTVLWSIIANQMHNIDYRVGEGRFNIELQDYFEMPQLVADGDCTVAAGIPEAAAPLLRNGELEIMYGGRMPFQIYQEEICKCDHDGPMSGLFVATQEWYDANPDQAAAFLRLWERGLRLWRENKGEIIGLYPDLFAIDAAEDADYMAEFIDDNDWFADTVYMDDAWIEEERRLYEYMIDSGWMEEGAPMPRFDAVAPPS